MNAHTTPLPDPAAASQPDDWAQALLHAQIAMLTRLAEGGLAVAAAIEAQATGTAPADAPPLVKGDLALAYARVARAVRMTLALQSKLIEDLRSLEAGVAEAVARARHENDNARLQQKEDRRDHLASVLDRIIEAETDDGDTIEALSQEAAERLQDEDLYEDILARPFNEIVADICRDLGLEPDWAALAQEPWMGAEGADTEVNCDEVIGGGRGMPPPPLRGSPPPFRCRSTGEVAPESG